MPAKKKQSAKPVAPKPLNLNAALRQCKHAHNAMNQWLATIAENVRAYPRTDVDLADILMHRSSGLSLSSGEAFIVARRLIRLSRDPEAINDLRWNTAPIARRICVKKTPL